MKTKFLKSLLIFYLLILSFTLTACKSLPKNEDNSIYVMIYDYENHGLKNVKISQKKEILAFSDIYGRAIISLEEKGKSVIEFEKTGYEKISVNASTERQRVLYIKMGSASYFAELTEQKFDEGKYEEAMENIDKALKIEQRSDYEYLKNVIEVKMNEKN